MYRAGVDDRNQHLDGGLMHARGDMGDVIDSQVVTADEIEQGVGCRVGVTAGSMVFE